RCESSAASLQSDQRMGNRELLGWMAVNWLRTSVEKMHITARLKRPLLVGVLATSLAACGSGGGEASEAGGADAAEPAASPDAIAEPGIAGMTSESVDAEFEDVADSDARLLAPGVDLQITKV